jgi:glycosyltransferase involved in cell wall biosynthesis
MKLIINTSNLNGGGGVQVGFSFINECVKFSDHEYHVFLCPKIKSQLEINSFPANFYFYDFPNPPKPTIKGLFVSKRLRALEKQIMPNCVFSIFGPTYWTPKVNHLMGFANPHFLYPDSSFFSIISTKEKLTWKILSIVKQFFFKHNANYYHVETNEVRGRLSKFLSCPLDSIFTVSNTYNSFYNSFVAKSSKYFQERVETEFRLVCISAYYSHKNLEIINKIVPLLIENGYKNIKFVLTISNDIFERIFTDIAKSQIVNIGPIPVIDCPQLYSECDALFLPTLLECFSVSYLEAMKMQLPILTSNLPFAHDICGDAALFFNPLDANEALQAIIQLFENKSLQFQLIEKGNNQSKKYNGPEERAKRYLKICENIVS